MIYSLKSLASTCGSGAAFSFTLHKHSSDAEQTGSKNTVAGNQTGVYLYCHPLSVPEDSYEGLQW